MKKIIGSLALMAICGTSFAQNSAIYKAETMRDKGQVAEAAQVVEEALVNPKTTKLAQMYNLGAELHAQLFNPELMKAAQNLPFDTLAFVSHLEKSINYYIKSHEADVTPDKKGRVKSKFIQANHSRMLNMLDYYNYAAVFMNQCGDKAKSLDLFKKYLALPKCAIFSAAETDSIYAAKRGSYVQTSMNLAILNYEDKNYDEALKYVDETLKDTVIRDLFVIQTQSYLAKKDSTAWLNALRGAVERTGDANFMNQLLAHYAEKKDLENARAITAAMVENNPDNKDGWVRRGSVELQIANDIAKAKEFYAKALAIDPNFPEANYNMGICYTMEVREKVLGGNYKLYNSGKQIITKADQALLAKEKEDVMSYYKKAAEHIEKYREFCPDQPNRWAYALQLIYSNLEMKDKKAEMDAIISGL